MKFFKKKKDINFIKDIDTSELMNFNDAKLVHVKGSGKLKLIHSYDKYDYYDSKKIITLNNIDLAYARLPGCDTSAGMIAAGKGIENANCKKLKDVTDKINEDFVSLDKSIEDISSILTLFETGLYIVCDVVCYPSDGEGSFFWNIKNDYTLKNNTGFISYDYNYLDHLPLFLYPTQTTDKYDNNRVDEYVQRFTKNSSRPRGIAVNVCQGINLLLDGHHKACAATLLSDPVNAIVIFPVSYIHNNTNENIKTYVFNNFKIDDKDIPSEFKIKKLSGISNKIRLEKHNVNKRTWENIYINNTLQYPTSVDIALSMFAKDIIKTDEEIDYLLNNKNEENNDKLLKLLSCMKIENDLRLKKVALCCATRKSSYIKRYAYNILFSMKNDSEVEEFFTNVIINEEDTHSSFRILADKYWD